MSKYELIHELCESRIFRSKAFIGKYDDKKKATMFYSILLSTLALALDPKTTEWAKKYASKTGAFGNFDFFRPSGTDLYVLTHIAQHDINLITPAMARNLLRIYKGLAKGDIDSGFVEQTLLRLERSLGIKNAQLRNARRRLMHWDRISEDDQKQTLTQLVRAVRLQAKMAEVLPYLEITLKGDPGHFGRMTPGKAALAIAGAGLAGLVIGLNKDVNKRGWRVFKNSAVFDGQNILKEDRPTQLFHIVQNLNHHPDIERIVSVHYIADGVSAFVRDTEGNAYELEIRPAPFAKGHAEKRGVSEALVGPADGETQECWNCNGSGRDYDEACYKCGGSGKLDDCGHAILDDDLEESGWQWCCTNVILEHTKDTTILGGKKKANAAAVIALTPDDLDHDNIHKNNKQDKPSTEAEVRAYLKIVRDRYDVEIVDDFLKYTGQNDDPAFKA